MYPVGGLTAHCGKEGGPILEISNTCWEAEDSQPSVQGPVVVEAWVTLNDGPADQVKDPVHQEECVPDLCSDEVTTKQLSTWAATALPHILEDVGTRDVWVKHSVLACKVRMACSSAADAIQQQCRIAVLLEGGRGSIRGCSSYLLCCFPPAAVVLLARHSLAVRQPGRCCRWRWRCTRSRAAYQLWSRPCGRSWPAQRRTCAAPRTLPSAANRRVWARSTWQMCGSRTLPNGPSHSPLVSRLQELLASASVCTVWGAVYS